MNLYINIKIHLKMHSKNKIQKHYNKNNFLLPSY